MDSGRTRWRITADYFENCNCDVVCPCFFSPATPLTSAPTEGACEVAFAFHIERGTFGTVNLNNLNTVVIARAPGAMADGNWSVALYLDDRADQQQREALQAIFTGAAGGPIADLSPLFSNVLGVKAVPITFAKADQHRSVEIPGVAHLGVHAAPSVVPGKEIWASNAHPFNPEGVAMAVGDQNSTWADYNMRWDNSGKNGHYAPINWSNS